MGITQFNTKKLVVGTYNVKITSGYSNYNIKAVYRIKIRK